MTIQKLDSFFSAAPELHQLCTHAYRLQQLRTALQKAVPSSLAPACIVSSLQQGVLTVHTENGAVALKLKQMAPRLLQSMQEIDSSIISLRIIVQIRDRNQTRTRNKPRISPGGFNILSEFAENLQDPALKSAVRQIIEHHKP